jgi:hypothetical protein
MKVLSFTFTSSDFEYALLSGSQSSPILELKQKILLPTNYNVPNLAGWFETQLDLVLNTSSPDLVSYRLTINNVTNDYVSRVYYGQAILNLLCSKRSIDIHHTSPVSIKPSKLGLTKEINLHQHLESLLGKQPAPWDKSMRDTILIALINL